MKKIMTIINQALVETEEQEQKRLQEQELLVINQKLVEPEEQEQGHLNQKALQKLLEGLQIDGVYKIDKLECISRDLEDKLWNEDLIHKNTTLKDFQKEECKNNIKEKQKEINEVVVELVAKQSDLKSQQAKLQGIYKEKKTNQVEINRQLSYILESTTGIEKFKKQIEDLKKEIERSESAIQKIETNQSLYQQRKQTIEYQQTEIKKLIAETKTMIAENIIDKDYLSRAFGKDTAKWTDRAAIPWFCLKTYREILDNVYDENTKKILKEAATAGNLGGYMQSLFVNYKGADYPKIEKTLNERQKLAKRLEPLEEASYEDRKIETYKALNAQFIDAPYPYLIKQRKNSLKKRSDNHQSIVQAMLHGVYGTEVQTLARNLILDEDGKVIQDPENNQKIEEIIGLKDSFEIDKNYLDLNWTTVYDNASERNVWIRNKNHSSSPVNSDNNPAKSSMDYYNIALGGVGALGLIGLCCALYRDPNAQKQLSTMGETMGKTMGETLWNNLCKLILTGSILGYGCAPTATQTQISDTFNKFFPAKKNKEVQKNDWSSVVSNMANKIFPAQKENVQNNSWSSYFNDLNKSIKGSVKNMTKS